jgi:predicted DNA-binding transcriptional regulator AlpA
MLAEHQNVTRRGLRACNQPFATDGLGATRFVYTPVTQAATQRDSGRTDLSSGCCSAPTRAPRACDCRHRNRRTVQATPTQERGVDTMSPDRPWTKTTVAEYFSVSERTIDEWRDADLDFPVPLELPGRSCRWLGEDVIGYARRASGRAA